jgi:hypothetical protein
MEAAGLKPGGPRESWGQAVPRVRLDRMPGATMCRNLRCKILQMKRSRDIA